jgi:ribosomal protein S18 acetylase RimI-like enzyme
VREPARGGGVGRALAQAAIARARERGCRRIELDVNEDNPAALALYEGLGFSAWVDRAGGRNLLMRLHV